MKVKLTNYIWIILVIIFICLLSNQLIFESIDPSGDTKYNPMSGTYNIFYFDGNGEKVYLQKTIAGVLYKKAGAGVGGTSIEWTINNCYSVGHSFTHSISPSTDSGKYLTCANWLTSAACSAEDETECQSGHRWVFFQAGKPSPHAGPNDTGPYILQNDSGNLIFHGGGCSSSTFNSLGGGIEYGPSLVCGGDTPLLFYLAPII